MESFKDSECDSLLSSPSSHCSETMTSLVNTSKSDLDLSDLITFAASLFSSDIDRQSQVSGCTDQPEESNDQANVTQIQHEEFDQEDTPIETYKLVFDNVDKTVRPRYMRMEVQNKSLHYVQLYAVKDRINLSHLSQEPRNLSEVQLDVTLPTDDDNTTLLETCQFL